MAPRSQLAISRSMSDLHCSHCDRNDRASADETRCPNTFAKVASKVACSAITMLSTGNKSLAERNGFTGGFATKKPPACWQSQWMSRHPR